MAYTDILSNTHTTDTELTSAEYNDLVSIVEIQGAGALCALGAGIVTGLQITAGSGLSAVASAGAAIIQTTGDIAFGSTGSPVTVGSLPDSTATLYFWAQALTPGSGYDTRLDGSLRIVYTTVNTAPVNSLPLALGHTSGGAFAVDSDLRVYCPARQSSSLAALVTALQTAVGIPYSGGTSLQARVTAIEDQPAGSTGGYADLANMPWSPGDTTPASQKIPAIAKAVADAEIAAAGITNTSSPVLPFDVDANNRALLTLRLVQAVDPDAAADLMDCAVYVPGVSGGQYIDEANSTWPDTTADVLHPLRWTRGEAVGVASDSYTATGFSHGSAPVKITVDHSGLHLSNWPDLLANFALAAPVEIAPVADFEFELLADDLSPTSFAVLVTYTGSSIYSTSCTFTWTRRGVVSDGA